MFFAGGGGSVLGKYWRRLIAPVTGRRSLDAGSTGRRWDGAKSIVHLPSDIRASGQTAARRAAYFVQNNAHAAAAVSALDANVIGTGIKPSSQHPDAETREHLHALWNRWVDEADFGAAGDFYFMQSSALRSMVITGEAFLRFRAAPDAGMQVPLQLQPIHSDQVPAETFGDLIRGNVTDGIEFDDEGRRLAYHVLPRRPGDTARVSGNPWETVRIPASEMLHVYHATEPGLQRGLSWFAGVLVALKELDELNDAALVRAKLGNLICAALVDANGDAGGLPGTQSGAVLNVGLEPGTIIPLRPGTSLEFFSPTESAHYSPFCKVHLQAIAAGLGIPYEVLTGDLEKVNYSSIRAGLIQFRAKVEFWQHQIIVHRLCRPTWDRWVRMAVLAGQIPADAYRANPAAFHAVSWRPPRFEWTDPLKQAQAELAMVNAGFKSRDAVIASMGDDPEQVDAEIAAGNARAARLGLNFTQASVHATEPAKETADAE